MKKKIAPIRGAWKVAPPHPPDAEPHSRLICKIDGRRFALDFWSQVTDLDPDTVPLARKAPENRR